MQHGRHDKLARIRHNADLSPGSLQAELAELKEAKLAAMKKVRESLLRTQLLQAGNLCGGVSILLTLHNLKNPLLHARIRIDFPLWSWENIPNLPWPPAHFPSTFNFFIACFAPLMMQIGVSRNLADPQTFHEDPQRLQLNYQNILSYLHLACWSQLTLKSIWNPFSCGACNPKALHLL